MMQVKVLASQHLFYAISYHKVKYMPVIYIYIYIFIGHASDASPSKDGTSVNKL